jgi:glycosyltransferase involved in cell wall biosynthesis
METTTRARNVNGQAAPLLEQAAERAVASAETAPRQIIGRFLEPINGAIPAVVPSNLAPEEPAEPTAARPALAVFCHEAADSFLGAHVRETVTTLAGRGVPVHLFARHTFGLAGEGVTVHSVGASDGDALEQVQEFTRRAGNAFLEQFPPGAGPVKLIGYEWSAVPVLSLLRGLRDLDYVLSLHSLERQRSDMSSNLARRIEEIEFGGLREARTLLLHDTATAEVARVGVPESADRVTQAHSLFPVWNFEPNLDPGSIKAQYQIGPLDPVLLYVGDLDDRYGPDLLLKAMPAILRNHGHARLVVVGDGNLLWPLRVYSRYLLLDYAVRLLGHVADHPLHQLIRAADMVVVPSRDSTPWWPVMAAWAARRPVVATHNAAKGLLEHEQDAVLCYPSENSIVWGVERVLFDAELRTTLGRKGRQKLDDRFGWNALAVQVEELTGVAAAR